jgi:hypothetical protein
MPPAADILVDGTATAYRLYDVGYAIDLDRVAALLGAETRGRARPERAEAQAFEIRHPPLDVALGERTILVSGQQRGARLSAHLFDFGVCSLRLTIAAPPKSPWPDFTAFGRDFDAGSDLATLCEREIDGLVHRIAPAIERPRMAPVIEDYVVFRIGHLTGVPAGQSATEVLTEDLVQTLLLGEQRPLSVPARRELLGSRFSYYAEDVVVLSWDNALVVEPQSRDLDVEFVVEFANAQLLELRVYDAELDDELPKLYDRIARARRRWPRMRFSRVLTEMQITVADITEIVERADNAFKVTDDVYLARIYERALEIFREKAWRSGIDRKLSILRETYSMLNAESQAGRAELLEATIVFLIVVELILGLAR